MKNNRNFLGHLLLFLREEKKWWLLPIILAFAIFTLLIFVTHNAPLVAPFVYTIF